MKAQLRRYTRYNAPEPMQEAIIIAFSGLVLNKDKHECALNEKPLSLTPTEFSLLWVLASNRGRVVSSEELFNEVWGCLVGVQQLRKK